MKQRGCLIAILLFVFFSSVGVAGALDKDTLVVVKSTEVITMDPHDTTDTPSEDLNHKIYESLVGLDQDLKLFPLLAEEWALSGEGKIWTFKLRKGIKFHSGAPFNAEAVKVNFDRVLKGNFKRTPLYAPVIEDVQVVDEYTVVFNLKEPFGPFLNILAHSAGLIVDPTYVKDPEKSAAMKKNPSGTGPFMFEEWEPGDYIGLKAFKDYWQGEPKLKKVLWKVAPEGSSRGMMAEAGDAHVVHSVNASDVERLQKHKDLYIESRPGLSVQYLVVNVRNPILSDRNVRKALAYSIDRDSLCQKVLKGQATPAHVLIAPTVNGYGGKGITIPFDIEKAKALLEESGWKDDGSGIRSKDGKKLSLDLWTSLQGSPLPEVFQGFARTVGMELKIEVMDWATINSRIRVAPEQGKSQVFIFGWSPSTADADWAYRPLLHSSMFPPSGSNYGYYANDFVDENIMIGMKASDNAARVEAYRKIDQQVLEDFPRIPVYIPHTPYAIRKEVKNIEISPLNFIGITHLTHIE
ncbi:MAG: ABC transporter substrate-binding protein [Synergistaceae bacterium]|jgi:ABC-type transport system substrate-binding protein|nr:ABC transporter substrate-binding protein [Synergistaceae bacterium]